MELMHKRRGKKAPWLTKKGKCKYGKTTRKGKHPKGSCRRSRRSKK